jgi:hypothetical protein
LVRGEKGVGSEDVNAEEMGRRRMPLHADEHRHALGNAPDMCSRDERERQRLWCGSAKPLLPGGGMLMREEVGG